MESLRWDQGWHEAVVRYIRWDIPHDVRGLGRMAARCGAIYRTLKTRGFVATALTTEFATVITPIPGDEVINAGTIGVFAATSTIGILKHRLAIQREFHSGQDVLSSRTAALS